MEQTEDIQKSGEHKKKKSVMSVLQTWTIKKYKPKTWDHLCWQTREFRYHTLYLHLFSLPFFPVIC